MTSHSTTRSCAEAPGTTCEWPRRSASAVVWDCGAYWLTSLCIVLRRQYEHAFWFYPPDFSDEVVPKPKTKQPKKKKAKKAAVDEEEEEDEEDEEEEDDGAAAGRGKKKPEPEAEPPHMLIEVFELDDYGQPTQYANQDIKFYMDELKGAHREQTAAGGGALLRV